VTRPPGDELPDPAPGEPTRIIRRAPTGPVPIAPGSGADDTRTGIIRRAPTNPVPVQHDPATTAIPRPPRDLAAPPGGTTAVAACVMAMLSGWATSVVATDLINGWWDTDRLFCAAVGFLAFVFAASTICGVVMLLQRRQVGRYLITVGAVVALLALCGVFIAGAKLPWFIYVIPALPVASAVLALLPSTRRWCTA